MNKIERDSKLRDDNISKKSSKMPLVSLVVPAYNEAKIIEKNLATLCQYMKTLENEFRWELFVINDGSTDETGDLADEFVKDMDNAYVLHHMFNFRLGQALRTAFNQCKGDIIIVMDIDLSYSPDHIAKMLQKMKNARAKIVIASPFTKDGKISNVPWKRKKLSVWANRFLCLFASRDLFSDKITNITGMVRAYDGRFLRKLSLKAMDVDINAEIIYKAKILRARIVEIPAHLHWKVIEEKESSKKQRESSLRIMRTIAQSVFSGFIFRPFMFFIIPGFTILLLSLYTLTWTIVHTISHYNKMANMNVTFDYRMSEAINRAFQQSPHAFIVGGIALMVAIQLISFGLLTLQKKRYFEELFYLGTNIYINSNSEEKFKKI